MTHGHYDRLHKSDTVLCHCVHVTLCRHRILITLLQSVVVTYALPNIPNWLGILYFFSRFDFNRRPCTPKFNPSGRSSNLCPLDNEKIIVYPWDACPNHWAIRELSLQSSHTVLVNHHLDNTTTVHRTNNNTCSSINIFTEVSIMHITQVFCSCKPQFNRRYWMENAPMSSPNVNMQCSCITIALSWNITKANLYLKLIVGKVDAMLSL